VRGRRKFADACAQRRYGMSHELSLHKKFNNDKHYNVYATESVKILNRCMCANTGYYNPFIVSLSALLSVSLSASSCVASRVSSHGE
jgi:hypothetical protein